MVDINLVDSPGRTQVFKQAVLANLEYWQSWLGIELTDMATFDQERQTIVRAISFALDLEGLGWPAARQLIETFSPYMERRGHWEMWGRVLSRAVRVARQVKDEAGLVILSALLARLLSQQSRLKEATYYYRRTIRLARQIGDSFNEARACTNLGFHFIERGHWYRSEVLCCHALKIFNALDNSHGLAHTENHLGILYREQGRWETAREHLEKACAIWQAMGDEHGLMRGLINLGGLHITRKQPDAALTQLEKALQLAQSTGEETTTLGIIYDNMGIAHRLKGNLAEAEGYLKQAETIFRQFSNLMEQARVWYSLGLIYFSQGKESQAIALLEATLDAWRTLGNKYGEAAVLVDLVECEISRENWPKAEEYLTAVEQLISSDTRKRQSAHVEQSRLIEYRRLLAGHNRSAKGPDDTRPKET